MSAYQPNVKPYYAQRREWRSGYLADTYYHKFIVDFTERGFFTDPQVGGRLPMVDGGRFHPQVFHPHISNNNSPDAAWAPGEGFRTVQEAQEWVEAEWHRMCTEAPYQRFRYKNHSWQKAIDRWLDRAGVEGVPYCCAGQLDGCWFDRAAPEEAEDRRMIPERCHGCNLLVWPGRWCWECNEWMVAEIGIGPPVRRLVGLSSKSLRDSP